MKINKIIVGSNCDNAYNIGMTVNGITINHFKERTVEWENGIDFIYHAEDKEGNVIVSIENVPTIIEYEKD